MAKFWIFFLLGCAPKMQLSTSNQPNGNAQIGTIEARHQVLLAYKAQYNQIPSNSMTAFSRAVLADSSEDRLYLLWGDSAWEQDLKEDAFHAWKEYKRCLSKSDTMELELVNERLERP